MLFVVNSKVEGKGIPYSITSIGVELIPVSRQSVRRRRGHKPGGRLPLLSTRPAVTGREHHRPLTGTKLYCLVTESHVCEQLAQGRYLAVHQARFEPGTFRSPVRPATVQLPPRHPL